MILFRALRAHRKHLHARPLPVVGKRVEDRQARPAAGAVDKGVKVSPVRGVVQLGLALLADRDVRGDKDLPLRFRALYDLKGIEGVLRAVRASHVDLEHSRPSGRFLLQKVHKVSGLFLASLGEDLHIGAFIAHGTGDPRLRRVARDGRAKAHPLYDAIYFDPQCFSIFSGHNLPETAKCGSPANTPSKQSLTRGIMTGSAMIIS